MDKEATLFPQFGGVPGKLPLRRRHDPMPGMLATVFRIASVVRLPQNAAISSLHVTHARLFHARGELDVHWYGTEVDPRIARGALVAIQWMSNPLGQGGSIQIAGLQPTPCSILPNLFDLVPPAWGVDPRVVRRSPGGPDARKDAVPLQRDLLGGRPL